VAVVLATAWLGYTRESAEAPVVERPVPVEVEPVGTGAVEQTIEFTGWIAANTRVEVASKVAGRLESLSVATPDEPTSRRPIEVGLSVTRGQELAVIDRDLHLARFAAAEAEVKAKEVQLARRMTERAVVCLPRPRFRNRRRIRPSRPPSWPRPV
jgi:multidrug efflux pump subunit AcrA (membrane-fusion protein)